LTAAQRFELIKASMEERRTTLHQRFWLLILAGMMILLAVAWLVYSFVEDTQLSELESTEAKSNAIRGCPRGR